MSNNHFKSLKEHTIFKVYVLLSASIKANALCVEQSVTFFIHHSGTLFLCYHFTTPTHTLELPLEAYSEHHRSLSLKNKHNIGT